MIIGRKRELDRLENIYRSNRAEFLAIYGRRRVGKTYLISEYFKDKGIYFELTGIRDAKLSEQLKNFNTELSDVFYQGKLETTIPANWQDAFAKLRQCIESIKVQQKIILFFDELPWLASRHSNLLNALDHLWNRYLSRMPNVILIICGSAASWMINKVINDKGGLHGRITQELQLSPFDLSETESYLQYRNIHLDRKQIIDIYMAIGGIPTYLSYIKKGYSSAQIINDLCFSHQSPLLTEFHKLYASLFDHARDHINIVKALASKLKGLTQDELLKQVGLTSGGTSSHILRELEASHFIGYFPDFGKQKKGGRYRLIDEYSLFYLKWIDGAPQFGLHTTDPDYWLKLQTSRAWAAWSGYAFENICLKHIGKIKEALGIRSVNTSESSWVYKPSIQSEGKGAQIDLIIDRADQCINLCEIKYAHDIFTIDKEYVAKLCDRKRIFIEQTKSKKTIFTTFITTYGVVENEHYFNVVDGQLAMNVFYLNHP